MVIYVISAILIVAAYAIGLAKGRRKGYNECLVLNRSAFDSEHERRLHQKELIAKAVQVGRLMEKKNVEKDGS